MADRIVLVMPGRLAARWWALRTWPARRRAMRLGRDGFSMVEFDRQRDAIAAALARGADRG